MGTRLTTADLRRLTDNRDKTPRQRAGAKAYRHGENFQRMLDFQHRQYRDRLQGAIDRLNVPTVPVPYAGKGQPLRRVTGKSGVDYWGVMMLGTRSYPVAIEAKHHTEKQASLAIVPEGSGLHVDQLAYLASLARSFGVLSLILWENGERLGILSPALVVGAFERYSGKDFGISYANPAMHGNTKPNRIPADAFHWLKTGDFDYLARVREWVQEPGKSIFPHEDPAFALH